MSETLPDLLRFTILSDERDRRTGGELRHCGDSGPHFFPALVGDRRIVARLGATRLF